MSDPASIITAFLTKNGVPQHTAAQSTNLVMKRGMIKQPFTDAEMKLLTLVMGSPEARGLTGTPVETAYKYQLKNVHVTGFQTSGSAGAPPAAKPGFGTKTDPAALKPVLQNAHVTSFQTHGSAQGNVKETVMDIANAINTGQPLRTAAAKAVSPATR